MRMASNGLSRRAPTRRLLGELRLTSGTRGKLSYEVFGCIQAEPMSSNIPVQLCSQPAGASHELKGGPWKHDS